MYDPLIVPKRILMQRIQDFTRYGYHYYTIGYVPYERAARLVNKFDRYYRISADKNERHRARLRGEGSAYLLLYIAPDQDRLMFILMVTDGDHPAHKLENLKDAREPHARITITGYELVRQTRAGSDRPVITWRMTKSNYENWRERIRKTVRSRGEKSVQEMITTLVHSPGFSGIRTQVKRLGQLFRAEWKRANRKPTRPPALPRIFYVQRLANDGMHLSQFIKRHIKRE